MAGQVHASDSDLYALEFCDYDLRGVEPAKDFWSEAWFSDLSGDGWGLVPSTVDPAAWITRRLDAPTVSLLTPGRYEAGQQARVQWAAYYHHSSQLLHSVSIAYEDLKALGPLLA